MACLHLEDLFNQAEGSFQYIALHCCLTIRPNSLGQDARVLSTWRRTTLSLLLLWIDIYMILDSLQATCLEQQGTATTFIPGTRDRGVHSILAAGAESPVSLLHLNSSLSSILATPPSRHIDIQQ